MLWITSPLNDTSKTSSIFVYHIRGVLDRFEWFRSWRKVCIHRKWSWAEIQPMAERESREQWRLQELCDNQPKWWLEHYPMSCTSGVCLRKSRRSVSMSFNILYLKKLNGRAVVNMCRSTPEPFVISFRWFKLVKQNG